MKTVDALLKRTDIRLFLLCYVFFTLFSGVDIYVSSLFYTAQEKFYLDDILFNRFIHTTFARIHIVWLLLFIFGFIYYRRKGMFARQKAVLFLIVTMVVGPGLLVNVFIKDNSIGRARPVHIQEFGGDATFTPAFIQSGQCEKNCSFVSGHASIGFYAIALSWLYPRRRWFWTGFSLGAVIGASRIMEGGHFLSDVIFAFWAVYFTTLIIGKLFGYTPPPISLFKPKEIMTQD